MKKLFAKRQKSVAVPLPTVLSVLLIVFGGFYIFKSIDYGGEFQANREESRKYLRAAAGAQMEAVTQKILAHTAAIVANDTTSMSRLRQLHAHLDSVKQALEQIAITDRSTSLDNVFERYSTLVGIVTLMFGGLGIFTGLQFYEQSRQTREEFESVSRAIDETAKNARHEMGVHVRQTKDELIRTAESGSAMIWVVASALEKLINLEVVDDKESTSILNSLYLSGFRFQLHSRNESERTSALQNIWAQGDCTDLKVLYSIWKDESEPAQLRNLARKATEKILKNCMHQDGHHELEFS